MRRKRVLVIGATGQLARCLSDAAGALPTLETVLVGSEACDVEDRSQTSAMLRWAKPDAVVNLAAFHDLRACEEDFDTAFRVNALGVGNLLDGMFHCDADCHLYHFSTDYVFDGTRANPHDGAPAVFVTIETRPYTIHANTEPMSNYGRTKRAGELIALESGRATVIRTASLFSKYGSTGKGGSNFLLAMLKKAMEPRPRNLRESMELPNGGDQRIHVDSDVVMSPTYAPWLARTVLHMVAEDIRPPLAHVVCDGPPVSWHDFAKAIFETGLDVTGDARFSNALSRLTPKVSDPWPSRPKFSAMENSLPNTSIGTWRSAIEHFFFYEWANISLEESQ